MEAPGAGVQIREEKASSRPVAYAKADFGYVPPADPITTIAPGSEGRVVAITPTQNVYRRPSGHADPSEKRLGNAGGFREFDGDAEAERRRRAAEERQQRKEERKAEKKKCDYCKRASCIC